MELLIAIVITIVVYSVITEFALFDITDADADVHTKNDISNSL